MYHIVVLPWGANANTNASAANELVSIPIGVNANAIGLTDDFEVLPQIRSTQKKPTKKTFAFTCRIPCVRNLG